MDWTLDDVATIYLLCGLATGAWQAMDLLANRGEGMAKELSGIPAIDQLPWLPRIWLALVVVTNLVIWPRTLLCALGRWARGPLLQRIQTHRRRLELQSTGDQYSDRSA